VREELEDLQQEVPENLAGVIQLKSVRATPNSNFNGEATATDATAESSSAVESTTERDQAIREQVPSVTTALIRLPGLAKIIPTQEEFAI